MKTTRKFWRAAAVMWALALGGCFGGSADETPASGNSGAVPDSAGASVSAFIGYLLALGSDDETSEPATIKDSFAVPPDETDDVKPLS
jgi:hypothetical protein